MPKGISDDQIQLAADCMFKKYDLDQDGFLDADEVAMMIQESYHTFGKVKNLSDKKID